MIENRRFYSYFIIPTAQLELRYWKIEDFIPTA